MTKDERLVRKNFRILKTDQDRINKLLEKGHYVNESELLRKCLRIGLQELESADRMSIEGVFQCKTGSQT